MVRLEYTQGFEGLKKCLEELSKPNGKLYLYFTGNKNSEGVSWCPDCNEAHPFIMEAVNKYTDDDTTFLTVEVGNKEYWKDMKNPFRTDASLRLMVIPTLIKYKTVIRLEGSQCNKHDLLEMLFNEE